MKATKGTIALFALIAFGGAAIGHPAASPAKKGSSAPKTKAGRDWSHVASLNSQGNIVLGNPAAPVKLIEYMSFTCSHCAAFSDESAAVLKGQMIRSGSTSLEYRPAVRDSVDLAATLLVRCVGVDGYADAASAVFASQSQWLPGAFYYLQHDAPRYALRGMLDQIRLAAQGSGLIDLMLSRGMSQARIDACLADQASVDRTVQAADGWRSAIHGTPTFVVNGQSQPTLDWAALAPILRAKGAR